MKSYFIYFVLLLFSIQLFAQQETSFTQELELLNKQIIEQESNIGLYYKRAKLYYEFNDYSKSLSDIKRVLKVDSVNQNYLMLSAKIYQGIGNVTFAIREYKKLYAIDSTSIYSISQLAKLYEINRQVRFAYPYYENWILLDSVNLYPKAQIAKFVLKSGETQQAIDLFTEIFTQDSNYLPALNYLSLIYYKLNEPDTAIYFVKKALEIDSENIKYIERLANFYFHRNHNFLAIPLYEKVITMQDSTPAIVLKLGMAYYGARKYNKAIKPLQYAAYKVPENYVPHRYLAETYYELKDSVQSVAQFEKAYDLFQPDARIKISLETSMARSYFQKGDFANAAKYYTKVLQKEQSSIMYFEIARVYDEGLNDKKKALHFFARYLQKMEGIPNFESTVNYARSREKKLKEDLHFKGELY